MPPRCRRERVSLDYLAVDGTPRRPLHVDDPGLTEQLAQAVELLAEDRAALLNVLDALLTKTRVKGLFAFKWGADAGGVELSIHQ